MVGGARRNLALLRDPAAWAGYAAAALGAGALVEVWHPGVGVILEPVERLRAAGLAAAGAGALCALLRQIRVPPLVAGILPLALIEAFRWVDIVGGPVSHVDRLQAAGLLACAVAAAGLGVRWPRAVAALLAAVTIVSAAKQALPSAPSAVNRPPLLLITLDTVRADHIAGFGGDVALANTPALNTFFESARVFRHAYAPQPITGPSHTSMLSGLDVELHGVNANGVPVPSSIPWVPDELRAAGWHTRAAVSAAVLDSSMQFGRGFDDYDSAFDSRLPRAFPFLNVFGYRAKAGTAMSRWGAETLKIIGSFPRGTFTWVHLYDAHWPYTPSPLAAHFAGLTDATPLPKKSVGRQRTPSDKSWPLELVQRGKDLYRAELSDLDIIVRRVLERVPSDATVVISGDHGESLDEHEYVFAHGRLPYAPDVHTVLAVRGPGIEPEWIDTPVSLTMIADTLRAVAGLPSTTKGMLDTPATTPVVSVAYMKGAAPSHPLGALSGVSVRQNGRASVWTRWNDPESFDVAMDPRELVPTAVDPNDAVHLHDVASGALSAAKPAPEMQAALEALGYTAPD